MQEQRQEQQQMRQQQERRLQEQQRVQVQGLLLFYRKQPGQQQR